MKYIIYIYLLMRTCACIKTIITLLYKVKDIILTKKIKFSLMQKEEIKD